MKLTQFAVAGLAALAMGAASAAPVLSVVDGGDLGANPNGVSFTALEGSSAFSFQLVDNAGPGSFTTFNLAITDLVSVFGSPISISSMSVIAGRRTIQSLPGSSSSFTFTDLLAGDYQLKLGFSGGGITLPVFGSLPGTMTGKVTAVGTVTPVPEAGSIAMAVAGLGVVGLIAARRRKA